MILLQLDYFAYNNRLKQISIGERLLLGAGSLGLALALPRPATLLALIALMHGVMLYAKIPPRYLLRLWLAPLTFLAVSLLTVVASVSAKPFPAFWAVKVGAYYAGITAEGIAAAALLLLRSLAAVSCLFMLATTTPVGHIVAYLSRVPGIRAVAEIALLTYRFIFVVLATAGQIFTAQQSRLGYANPRRALAALSLLAASIGRKSFIMAGQLHIALLARNYHDRLVFRQPTLQVSPVRLTGIAAVLAGIALTAFI
ncbi:cobalt ECF transporter T component CbiQ [Sporolituus thermophilus]|uniref:Cobalt/nickel transport system permease protein n=1 Tax=Sporolituus thermophilus DSM 23256 TaxID=1123285 RepID=A0A1G7HRD0_9FIRM|nr:cobalt ECF transporter T component CbiQ [Sporolituus thermophilus]SDF03010.1 cobalt/nickel transport system permease protein [Sporolituus thermophilus DSM 23256]